MRNALNLTHVAAVVMLTMASAAASASDNYSFRMFQKGTRAAGGAPAPGGDAGAAQPDAQQYATSGVQYLQNGTVTDVVFLTPLQTASLTLRNSSNLPLKGYLLTSTGGSFFVTFADSTCSQDSANNVPLTLPPGGECTFKLTAKYVDGRGYDSFYFRSTTNVAIASVLHLPGLTGGSLPSEDM